MFVKSLPNPAWLFLGNVVSHMGEEAVVVASGADLVRHKPVGVKSVASARTSVGGRHYGESSRRTVGGLLVSERSVVASSRTSADGHYHCESSCCSVGGSVGGSMGGSVSERNGAACRPSPRDASWRSTGRSRSRHSSSNQSVKSG